MELNGVSPPLNGHRATRVPAKDDHHHQHHHHHHHHHHHVQHQHQQQKERQKEEVGEGEEWGGGEEELPARIVEDAARMKAFGKEGRWREALKVLDKLKEDSSFSSLVSSSTPAQAEGREMAVPAPDLKAYNAAVGAVAKSGRWHEVRASLPFKLPSYI